ncbi:Hypothetical protein FKW44_005900, partial [Caligus rogercresseyi]
LNCEENYIVGPSSSVRAKSVLLSAAARYGALELKIPSLQNEVCRMRLRRSNIIHLYPSIIAKQY